MGNYSDNVCPLDARQTRKKTSSMKKIWLFTLAIALCQTAHAQNTTQTQSVALKNVTFQTTGAPKITADKGHYISLTNSEGLATTSTVSSLKKDPCLIQGVSITGNATIRCVH
jgi:hypothetical protein